MRPPCASISMPAQVEPQSHAAHGRVGSGRRKRSKTCGHGFGRDADALVAAPRSSPSAVVEAAVVRTVAAVRRVLDRVFVEIAQHLDQRVGVAFGRRQAGRDLDHEARDRAERADFGRDLARAVGSISTGSVAGCSRPAMIAARLSMLPSIWSSRVLSATMSCSSSARVSSSSLRPWLGQQVGAAVDRGQRRAELVRDEREKIILELLGFAQSRDVLLDDHRPGDVPLVSRKRRGLGQNRELAAVRAFEHELLIANRLAAQCR